MGCILAIESSCDETAAAVVDERLRVRASVVASQHDLHAEFGGVVPEIASRAHLERVLPVIRKALDDARLSVAEIEGVAAGVRPGLIGSLLVGAAAAKGFAWARGLPFYGVDHVVAHLFAGLAAREGEVAPEARFPALGLVVSGGHTSLFRISGPREVELLGRTIDDAVGEALDKAATMLGLPHPGGPSLEKLAVGGDPDALRFALPRLPSALDFSLSGMKTKLLYEIRGVPEGRGASARFPRSLDDVPAERRRDLAASVQRGVFAQVIDRLSRAADLVSPQTFLVGGGVVANRSLRALLEEWTRARGIDLVLPRPEHCVDNAAMIAVHAQLRRRAGDLGDDLSEPVEAVSTLARGLRGKGVRA